MLHSKIVNFCYGILPFRAWKDFLLCRHLEKCPHCSKLLATQEEAKSILLQAEEVQNLDDLSLLLQEKLKKEKITKRIRQKRLLLKWQWAIAIAVALLAVTLNLWVFKGYQQEKIEGAGEFKEHESFELNYVKIESEPAHTFIFRPHDSKVIIVWAEKNI